MQRQPFSHKIRKQGQQAAGAIRFCHSATAAGRPTLRRDHGKKRAITAAFLPAATRAALVPDRLHNSHSLAASLSLGPALAARGL